MREADALIHRPALLPATLSLHRVVCVPATPLLRACRSWVPETVFPVGLAHAPDRASLLAGARPCDHAVSAPPRPQRLLQRTYFRTRTLSSPPRPSPVAPFLGNSG